MYLLVSENGLFFVRPDVGKLGLPVQCHWIRNETIVIVESHFPFLIVNQHGWYRCVGFPEPDRCLLLFKQLVRQLRQLSIASDDPIPTLIDSV